MYSRSNSVTITERFASSRTATRSTEPEVFTFERIPAQATAVRSYVPIRPRKRCTRVMYPAKVRMHLPPPERSRAKRWLVVLCLVVLWQIYTEEPCAEEGPAPDYQAFALQSAEERAQSRRSAAAAAAAAAGLLTPGERGDSPGDHVDESRPVPAQEPESSRGFEQSAGKGYMVALLVYHRLGSDN